MTSEQMDQLLRCIDEEVVVFDLTDDPAVGFGVYKALNAANLKPEDGWRKLGPIRDLTDFGCPGKALAIVVRIDPEAK